MALSTSNSTQQSEINVTPLIDVLLVLLIIFMVIAPVTPHGLESRVPEQSKTAAPVLGPVSLRVLGKEETEANDRIRYEVDGRVVDRAQLSDVLLASLHVQCVCECESQVSYRAVAAAVGAAKAAGAVTIGLGRL